MFEDEVVILQHQISIHVFTCMWAKLLTLQPGVQEKGTVYRFHKDKNEKFVHQNQENRPIWVNNHVHFANAGMVIFAFLFTKKQTSWLWNKNFFDFQKVF